MESLALGSIALGTISSAATSVSGGIIQSKALKSQGQYQKDVAELNAQAAELAATDAIKRGEKNAEKLRTKGKLIRGAQRAGYAAQGIEVDSGSAAEVQAETARMTTEDTIDIRNNAWREAWGYRFEAQNLRSGGLFASLDANNKAQNTLLTSGLQATQTALGGIYLSSGFLPSGSGSKTNPAPYQPIEY